VTHGAVRCTALVEALRSYNQLKCASFGWRCRCVAVEIELGCATCATTAGGSIEAVDDDRAVADESSATFAVHCPLGLPKEHPAEVSFDRGVIENNGLIVCVCPERENAIESCLACLRVLK